MAVGGPCGAIHRTGPVADERGGGLWRAREESAMTGRLSRWGTGFLAGTVVITVAMTTVVACGSGGDAGGGKTALRFVWWGNDDRAKATKSAIDLFTRNNPDI